MSFQFVIDNAESISINRRRVVAATQSRDGTVRAVSRGGQAWRFEVRLPDGPRWSDYRGDISRLEALDRVTTANIQLNTVGQEWLYQYQGNITNLSAIRVTIPSSGNIVTLTAGQAASGFNFRAGDFIQLRNNGSVYTVAADVPFNTNNITLHRPILDAAGTDQVVRVGPACIFNVICTEFPDWTVFARDQVSWSGPFIFSENLV
jgi:hypothetical protein